jgi:hypothetical protein
MPPRMLDLQCPCGAEVTDFFVMHRPSRIVHLECGGEMEEVLRPRSRESTQWSERDKIVVFRGPDGKIRYPGRNDVQPPRGFARIEIRSHAALRQFEREHNVTAHVSGYDRNSGRAIDDDLPASKLPSERERWERFRESTRGIF